MVDDEFKLIDFASEVVRPLTRPWDGANQDRRPSEVFCFGSGLDPEAPKERRRVEHPLVCERSLAEYRSSKRSRRSIYAT